MRVKLVIVLMLLSNLIFGQEFIEKIFIRSYTKAEINASLPGLSSIYAVDLYKILYSSTKLDGSRDTLSGLLAEPISEGLLHPLIIYCHGTVDSRDDVPSRLSFESRVPLAYAGLGYVGIAPDYLGLGDSRETIHPYVHADTEVSASYDMISAIKEYTNVNGVSINDQLFVTGYSQGGHAAMALHRFLENDPSAAYEVTAASHLSGPYDLSGEVLVGLLSDKEYFFVSYLAHTFLSMQAAYGNIGNKTSLIFKEPYATQIDRFAREEITLFELNDILIDQLIKDFGKSVPKNMIRDSVLNELLTNANSTINQALRDNDVYDWAPVAPTRLYYCIDDDQVPYRNSIVAYETMIGNGSTSVDAFNIGPNLSHTQCAIPTLTLTLFFFNNYINLLSNNDDLYVDEGVKIFPNPAADILYIKDEKNQTGQASIFDLSGRRIYDAKVANGSVSLGFLPQGTYILQWTTDDYLYTSKFFKK